MAPLFVVIPKSTWVIREPQCVTEYHEWKAAMHARHERERRKGCRGVRNRLKRTSRVLFPRFYHDLPDDQPLLSTRGKVRPRHAAKLTDRTGPALDAIRPDKRYPDTIYMKHGENAEKERHKKEVEKDKLRRPVRRVSFKRRSGPPARRSEPRKPDRNRNDRERDRRMAVDHDQQKQKSGTGRVNHENALKAPKSKASIPIHWIPAPDEKLLARLSRHRKAWSQGFSISKAYADTSSPSRINTRPELTKHRRWTARFKASQIRRSTNDTQEIEPARQTSDTTAFKSLIRKVSFRDLRRAEQRALPSSNAAICDHVPPIPQIPDLPPPPPPRSALRNSHFNASGSRLPSPTLPNIARKTVSIDDFQPPPRSVQEGVGLGVSYGAPNQGFWSPGRRNTVAKPPVAIQESKVPSKRLAGVVEAQEQGDYFEGVGTEKLNGRFERPEGPRRKAVKRCRDASELDLVGMEQTPPGYIPSFHAEMPRETRVRAVSDAGGSNSAKRSDGPKRHMQRDTRQAYLPSEAASGSSRDSKTRDQRRTAIPDVTHGRRSEGPDRGMKKASGVRGVRSSRQTSDRTRVERTRSPANRDDSRFQDLVDTKRSTREPGRASVRASTCSSVYSDHTDNDDTSPETGVEHSRETVRFADEPQARQLRRDSRSLVTMSITDVLNEVEQDQKATGTSTRSAVKGEQPRRSVRFADQPTGLRPKRKSASMQDIHAKAYLDEVQEAEKLTGMLDEDIRPVDLQLPREDAVKHVRELIEIRQEKARRRAAAQEKQQAAVQADARDEVHDTLADLRVFSSSKPLRIPPPGSLVVSNKRPGVDTSVHPALRDGKPLPEPTSRHSQTVERSTIPPQLADHLLRSTGPAKGRRPSNASVQTPNHRTSDDGSTRDSRSRHTLVPRGEQDAMLRILNRVRTEAGALRLSLEPKLSYRAQTHADMVLPPITPAKETEGSNIARHSLPQGTVIQPIAPFSPLVTQVKTVRLISPAVLSAVECAQLWAAGKTKRHKTISTTLSPSMHRYTRFPLAGRIASMVGSAPPTPESDDGAEFDGGAKKPSGKGCKGSSCDCKEYDAWATLTDKRWRGAGIGRAGDGRFVVDLVEMPGLKEGNKF